MGNLLCLVLHGLAEMLSHHSGGMFLKRDYPKISSKVRKRSIHPLAPVKNMGSHSSLLTGVTKRGKLNYLRGKKGPVRK